MAKTTQPAPQPPQPTPAAPQLTYKSFTVLRAQGGWSMITTTIEVDAAGNPQVTNVEKTQPDIKAVALEQFKIAAYNYWTAQ